MVRIGSGAAARLGGWLLSVVLCSAAWAEGDTRTMEAIRLTHPIQLDSRGVLRATAGLYVKVKDAPDGGYYAGGRFAGAGVLSGGTTEVMGISSGHMVAVPGAHRMALLEVLNDGVTICGVDASLTRMSCANTDALAKRRAVPSPAPPPIAATPRADPMPISPP